MILNNCECEVDLEMRSIRKVLNGTTIGIDCWNRAGSVHFDHCECVAFYKQVYL